MSPSLPQRTPFFYGWVIVGVSFIVMIIAYGVWWSFPIFYIYILEEFGWTRAETASIFTIGSIIYGGGSFVAGVLFDRFGPRRLIPVAGVIIAIGCVISSLSGQIWHFLVAYGVFMGFGVIAAGFVTNAAVVSNWFVRLRGTALGIALIGDGAAPLLAVVTQSLILATGWRTAYLVLAATVLLTIVPLAAIFMRTRPEEAGLLPDGGLASGHGQHKAPKTVHSIEVVDRAWAETDWTLAKAMRTRRFPFMLGLFFTLGMGMGIILTHQVASTVDIGYGATTAAFVYGLTGFMAIIGRLGGVMVDRYGREAGAFLSMALMVTGLIALVTVGSADQLWMLYIYASLFGLGLGITSPVVGSTAADLFSGRGYGSILGFVNIGWGVGSGLGAWLGGLAYDISGGYLEVFIFAIVMFFLSMMFVYLSAPRKVRRVVRSRFPGLGTA